MPLRRVPDSDLQYQLLVFDEHGVERREPDGSLQSDAVKRRLADRSDPVTDVFFVSHGWKGDVQAAIEQNDRWIAAMASVQADRDAARQRPTGFRPLIIGLHWPSLPWGDESLDDAGGGVLSADDDARNPEAFAARIAATPAARAAIRTILQNAPSDADAQSLSSSTRAAYATLFEEAGLGTGNAGAPPGFDQPAFDPDAIVRDFSATQETQSTSDMHVLGAEHPWREAVLSPLRQLSFWKMKDRARMFGETGAHALLASLQSAVPDARFHLMGHSFGCIVVSAMVAGAPDAPPLARPVDSLFLVQGALSLWAYASDIPFARGTPGYFSRIAKSKLVRGPIVTTRSKHDTAVGRFYPLGARVAQQYVLGDELPQYGGMGAFGIQGLAAARDLPMRQADYRYGFQPGAVYNLEASEIIRNGEGASGAHSDIAHPEVAHAFWCAVLAGDTDAFLGGVLSDAAVEYSTRGAEDAVDLGWSTPPSAPMAPGPDVSGGDGFRGAGSVLSSASSRDATPSAPVQRFINVELEDHARDEALRKGEWYTLAFDVDMVQRVQAIVGQPLLNEDRLFDSGDDTVVLTVQLDSDDFEISASTRPLRLPRVGKSQGKARFDVSPRHDGPSLLKATIHKSGNFVQQIELTFDVGAAGHAPVQSTSGGRPVAAADVLRPRDIGLSISPGLGGYECIVWGAVSARARLTLQPAELGSAIDVARDDIMDKVVMYRDATGGYPFQQSIDIPQADLDAVLKVMARAGARLFDKLFFGPGAGDDSQRIGNFLKQKASDPATRLRLQIVASSTPVPWSLLYVGDASANARLDWDNFIGMRHVVEQIPLQTKLSVTDSTIRSDQPELCISVNVNESIDRQMNADYVARQTTFWSNASRSRQRLRVTDRTKASQLTAALADATTRDQILYLYCHAKAAGLADPRGPDAASLVLSDGSVMLGDLALDAPTTKQLPGAPLVFINACESAEMSPTFYDGFVPYFMSKGARGVVGTECKTPALFATEWAKRFFERFLDGEPLGEAFLALRREFLERHCNPLGLLYAVHCDGDTRIEPALMTST
jgi:hypothetical protein